jgi:hypothetical protein
METDLKTAAEITRRLLDEGLITVESVRLWADEQMSSFDAPPHWLIEVSLAKSEFDAAATLTTVPGTPNEVAIWHALMKGWLALLEKDPERDSDIAHRLYFIGIEDRSPIPGLDSELMSFWDAIDLARDGIYGSREAERDRLRSFLARW